MPCCFFTLPSPGSSSCCAPADGHGNLHGEDFFNAPGFRSTCVSQWHCDPAIPAMVRSSSTGVDLIAKMAGPHIDTAESET